jgi:hypothetical protein
MARAMVGVGAAARRERHDEAYRPGRVLLRDRCAAQERQRDRREYEVNCDL